MKEKSERPFRIRIFQPIVPEYRVALFEGIGKRYKGRAEIWASPNIGHDISYPLQELPYDYNHEFRRVGPFQWQTGFSLKGLRRGDVIVVCGDVHQLSSLWIALLARIMRIRVVWWGHHWTANTKMSRVKIRLWFAKRLSDVYLCYTRTGIDFLETHGFSRDRLFATGNTVNQVPIKAAINAWDEKALAAFRKKWDLDGKVLLLICSVLRAKVRLPQLIQALSDRRLQERRVVLAIIGDGPEEVNCRKYADELGVADNIIWVGATRDQHVMAPWFMTAKAFVYPGPIGLSILHSLSYGLPVIAHGTKEHQMPEFEIMEDGKTGLMFEENSVADMTEKIVWAIDNPIAMSEMGAYSRQKAWHDYSMDAMIANYSAAIECAGQINS